MPGFPTVTCGSTLTCRSASPTGTCWRERGRPDIGDYARSYEDDSVPGQERIDLSGWKRPPAAGGGTARLAGQALTTGRSRSPRRRPDGGHVPGRQRCGLADGPRRGRLAAGVVPAVPRPGKPGPRGLRAGTAGLRRPHGRGTARRPRLGRRVPPRRLAAPQPGRQRGTRNGAIHPDLPAVAEGTGQTVAPVAAEQRDRRRIGHQGEHSRSPASARSSPPRR